MAGFMTFDLLGIQGILTGAGDPQTDASPEKPCPFMDHNFSIAVKMDSALFFNLPHSMDSCTSQDQMYLGDGECVKNKCG